MKKLLANTLLQAALILIFGSVQAQTAAQAAPDAHLLAGAAAEQTQVLKTLERLVNIETGTGDHEGLASMAALLKQELQNLGATVTLHPSKAPEVGDIVEGRLRGKGSKKILMIAHMDTVYARGALAKAPFRIEGNRAFGPGIADDKSGIAVILHSLKLLKARRFEDFGMITVLINADEEKGSDGSADLIALKAREHDVTLSFEPNVVPGMGAPKEVAILATAGIANAKVQIKGKSAHAGANPESGTNALTEASDFMLGTTDIDNKQGNFRFNWTLIDIGTNGGAALSNVIPDLVNIEANVRYANLADLTAATERLNTRAAKPKFPESKIAVNMVTRRPAFVAGVQGKALIDQALAIYKQAGGDWVVIPFTGGGTDAAFAGLAGKPVMEGLGLPGFGYHTSQAEFVLVDTIPRRLYLTTKLLMELSN